jgi:mRNA interferase MazF
MERELFYLNETFNVFMNITEDDKARFKKIVAWASKSMELSVQEKLFKSLFPKRGEVWTCNFGENVGSEINGTRPVLILQNDMRNEKGTATIGAPITNREPRQDTHVQITPEDIVSDESELTGTIILEQTRIISKARLGKKIAVLSDFTIRNVERSLLLSLGFSEEIFLALELLNNEKHQKIRSQTA